VATPVSPGYFHQLEYFQLASRWHVRATAQVNEIAFAVQADRLVGRNGGNDLCLVVLADALEELDGVVAQPLFAGNHFVFLGQFRQFLFQGFQNLGRKDTLVGKVVIKADVNHRADGNLGIRKQALDRGSQQVSGGVTNQIQTGSVFGANDGQIAVLVDHIRGVHQTRLGAGRADTASQGGAAQASTNRVRHFADGNRALKLSLGAIGQCDSDHNTS